MLYVHHSSRWIIPQIQDNTIIIRSATLIIWATTLYRPMVITSISDLLTIHLFGFQPTFGLWPEPSHLAMLIKLICNRHDYQFCTSREKAWPCGSITSETSWWKCGGTEDNGRFWKGDKVPLGDKWIGANRGKMYLKDTIKVHLNVSSLCSWPLHSHLKDYAHKSRKFY